MKTTKEFKMSRSAHTMLPGADMAIFRIKHCSSDWRADVVMRMAVLQILTTTDGWCDYLTIREPAEVAQIEQAIGAMPITTTTPVDAEIGKILEQHFPSVDFLFEDATAEVDVIAIENAVKMAFAAGRDFEARKIAKKTAKAKTAKEVA